MKVGYVYDPIYLKHDTGAHPENAKRLEAIMAYLEKTGLLTSLVNIPARPATIEEIAAVHTREHIEAIKALSERGGGFIDSDTVVSPLTYQAALYAAGGGIEAADAVMQGRVNSAFALVRPPGHHATSEQAMGFCFFNNIAIAAKYVFQKYNLVRILIVDFDVHHGNGTQQAFYREPRLCYISTHESPLFPGTGNVEEIGTGAAKGRIINIPLPAGCGEEEYMRVYNEIVIPSAKRFKPQLVLSSAGYDSHWADDLAMMSNSVTSFARMVTHIKQLAEEFCQGKLVLFLEGGYNLNALAASVKATFDVLLGNEFEDPLGPPRRRTPQNIDALIKEIKRVHHLI